MVSFISPLQTLTRTAIKTLDFFIQFLHSRSHSHPRRTHTSAVDDPASGDDFISRFLQISKKFPRPNPNSSLSPNSNPNPNQSRPRRLLQYDALISTFNRSQHPQKTLALFHHLKDSAFFRPNLFIYTKAINALAESNQFQEAEVLFKEMIDSDIVPDAGCCTILIKMYSFYLKQFSWAYGVISWMIHCGIQPNVITYRTLISGLCRDNRIDEARHLMLVEMKRLNYDPDVVCYRTIFIALVGLKRFREADDLFWEMMRSGIMPDVVFGAILVKMYSLDQGKCDSAREVMRWMGRAGCEANVVTYSTLVNGLCQEGRVEKAGEIIDVMLKANCMPNCLTFTPMLQAYCADGRIKEAKRVLDWMESIGCSPDTVCYNVVIEGLCRWGDFDEVENTLRESSSRGWKPDAVTYNSYINRLCKDGRSKEAFRQLEVMLGKGLQPDGVTLNIFLDCLCRESGVWEIKHLLERSSELGLDVDVVSYNTVMSRLCEVEEWFSVLKLFTDMLKKGIQADTRSFNIFIYSLCKAGKFCKAKCIFYSKGIVPDVVSCNILMHQYFLAGKTKDLNQLISYMQINNIAPNTATCNVTIDSYCRDGRYSEALHFFKSLEVVYSQDVIVHLTNGLVKGGRIADLLKLFEELLDKGLVLDCQVYDFLITAFCQKGSCDSTEVNKVCLILEKMLGV